MSLSCRSKDSLLVLWNKPSFLTGSINFYYIYIRSDNKNDTDFEEMAIDLIHQNSRYNQKVSISQSKLDTIVQLLLNNIIIFQFLISNLTEGNIYEVKVQAASHSVIGRSELIRGEFSETHRVMMECMGMLYILFDF